MNNIIQALRERVDYDFDPNTADVILQEAIPAIERLQAAATALYEAGHWHCDRPVDEMALWTELRDALGRDPGGAPKPLTSEGGSGKG